MAGIFGKLKKGLGRVTKSIVGKKLVKKVAPLVSAVAPQAAKVLGQAGNTVSKVVKNVNVKADANAAIRRRLGLGPIGARTAEGRPLDRVPTGRPMRDQAAGVVQPTGLSVGAVPTDRGTVGVLTNPAIDDAAEEERKRRLALAASRLGSP